MVLERDLYLLHELSCLAGSSPELGKRILGCGGLSRSEGEGRTVFPIARLADEPAVPFCKRKEKSKTPPATVIFSSRKMKYKNVDEAVPGF